MVNLSYVIYFKLESVIHHLGPWYFPTWQWMVINHFLYSKIAAIIFQTSHFDYLLLLDFRCGYTGVRALGHVAIYAQRRNIHVPHSSCFFLNGVWVIGVYLPRFCAGYHFGESYFFSKEIYALTSGLHMFIYISHRSFGTRVIQLRHRLGSAYESLIDPCSMYIERNSGFI